MMVETYATIQSKEKHHQEEHYGPKLSEKKIEKNTKRGHVTDENTTVNKVKIVNGSSDTDKVERTDKISSSLELFRIKIHFRQTDKNIWI